MALELRLQPVKVIAGKGPDRGSLSSPTTAIWVSSGYIIYLIYYESESDRRPRIESWERGNVNLSSFVQIIRIISDLAKSQKFDYHSLLLLLFLNIILYLYDNYGNNNIGSLLNIYFV